MTQAEQANEKVARAERRVIAAAHRWNAVDLPALNNCLAELESSASDLSDALDLLKNDVLKKSQVSNAHGLRSSVLDLQKAALRLQRLTDASASFLRCAPGLGNGEGGLYQAGGSMSYTATTAETRGMQV